ncbi:MAG: AMP-binding protein [Gammaproteobacteria bacterium]|nr:AMP-binding protein [Gammaproteobacteria bacterium]
MSAAPSFVHGTSATPLLYLTMGELLANAVRAHGAREALVVRHQNIRWSYQTLDQHVDALAAGLLALGLVRGERIGIWSPNNAEWVVTQFAAARAGLVLVNINPAYRLSELEYALNKVACVALVTASSFKSSDYLTMLRTLAPELSTAAPGALVAAKLPHLRVVIAIDPAQHAGMFRYADVPALAQDGDYAALRALAPLLQPDDPANIQFTSGTTGMPKGATLTHFNIVNNGFFVGAAMGFTAHDRLCIPVPLYHCFGMVMGVLTCVAHGATMVFPSAAFEPLAVLETVAEEQCTGLHGVPTMFIAELDHPEFARFDLRSLRTGIMAGAPCPVEVMKRVLRDMHMGGVTIAYGMTETSPVSFQSGLDDPIDRRVSTIGRVHPHVQVKIVDGDGRTVPRGEKGELCTRGYSVMLSYWDEPERTQESIDDAGWMHTGDLAVLDEEGYCNIVGRVKDMIIRGGENVYPREVEEFLHRHPKIQDVSVFGVPDPRLGEQVSAWIQLRAGETATAAEIQGFCQGQIAHYKIPHHVRFVDAFPMTVTGKIQKFVMRAELIDELGLTDVRSA